MGLRTLNFANGGKFNYRYQLNLHVITENRMIKKTNNKLILMNSHNSILTDGSQYLFFHTALGISSWRHSENLSGGKIALQLEWPISNLHKSTNTYASYFLDDKFTLHNCFLFTIPTGWQINQWKKKENSMKLSCVILIQLWNFAGSLRVSLFIDLGYQSELRTG